MWNFQVHAIARETESEICYCYRNRKWNLYYQNKSFLEQILKLILKAFKVYEYTAMFFHPFYKGKQIVCFTW